MNLASTANAIIAVVPLTHPSPRVNVDVPLACERWLQQAAQDGTDWSAVIDGCRDLLAIAVGGDTFERACYEADRKALTCGAHLGRLRRLLDDDVTLVAASAKLRKNRPIPAKVEALMYSLRRGIIELAQPDTLRRLSMLDEGQLKTVCHRLQKFKPEIATPWSSQEVAALIAKWKKLHG